MATELYTLTNACGGQACITNYGGIVVSLTVPDAAGNPADVVLGYDTLDAYVRQNPYFGCLVGRYGNRIAHGRFRLDGRDYVLALNDGDNHLHGGEKGFDKVVWNAVPEENDGGPALVLSYVSPNGEEGYPGTLSVKATYTLTRDNGLELVFSATTDAPTLCNLTHHSYFNLAGAGTGDILDHEVMINADRFTPVDDTLIPTGDVRAVEGTPLDFRQPTGVGDRINADDEQLRLAGGYDHNWVLNKQRDGELSLAARVREPASGRTMEVLTTEPGMQFYSGNFLDGTLTGKGGAVYEQHSGFCMEPQHYPDAPNKPAFPSAVLRPGDVYANTIVYRFGW
jgi:aldose 1-epimerase